MIRNVVKHPVARNALALYIVQFAGYVLPLITVPYLARVLGPEGWGLVVIAQSFASWVSLVLEYGFNLSASREISRYQDNPERIAQIAAGVMGAKSLILLGAIAVTLVVGRIVPAFKQHPEYLGWILLYTVALGFSPFWYFQGTERMSKAVLVEVFSRSLSTVGVLLLVRVPHDGWKALAVNALGGFLSTSITLVWVYREITWRWPKWNDSVLALKQGWSMFLYRGAVSLYTTANAFILGLFVSPVLVGYFGGAEKICRAAVGLLGPISQAAYPRINALLAHNPKQATRLARMSLFVTGALGIGLGITVVVAAPWMVRLLLGVGYEGAVAPLRVLALLLPLSAVSNALGLQWMLPLGLERIMSNAILIAGVFDVALATLLAPRFADLGMAWTVVSAEFCVVVLLVVSLYRRQSDPFGLVRR